MTISAFGGLQDPKVDINKLADWKEQTKANFHLKMFSGDHFFLRGAEDEMLATIEEEIFCTLEQLNLVTQNCLSI